MSASTHAPLFIAMMAAIRHGNLQSRALKVLETKVFQAADRITVYDKPSTWNFIHFIEEVWDGTCPYPATLARLEDHYGVCDQRGCGKLIFYAHESEEGNIYCSGDCLDESGDLWPSEND